MGDAYKNTVAAGATVNLTGLTEHGIVRVAANRGAIVEVELADDVWTGVLVSNGGFVADVGYLGTKLNITNPGTAAMNLRVSQLT